MDTGENVTGELGEGSMDATAELLDNAVVRDGSPDHWRESYVCETGKSMKAGEIAASQKGRWRNIAIAQVCAFLSPVWRTKGAKLR
jgi:hypothetical protein